MVGTDLSFNTLFKYPFYPFHLLFVESAPVGFQRVFFKWLELTPDSIPFLSFSSEKHVWSNPQWNAPSTWQIFPLHWNSSCAWTWTFPLWSNRARSRRMMNRNSEILVTSLVEGSAAGVQVNIAELHIRCALTIRKGSEFQYIVILLFKYGAWGAYFKFQVCPCL